MKYRSAFKTLILCQLPDNHIFQGYFQPTFPSLVDLSHSITLFPFTCGSTALRNVSLPHLGFPFPVGPPPSYRSLQGYSQLIFPLLVGLPDSELHYSPSHVGPPHCEKCGSATFRISLSGRSATFLPQLKGHSQLTFLSLVGPPHSELHYFPSHVGPSPFPFLVGLPPSSVCNHSFQSYQNPVNGG